MKLPKRIIERSFFLLFFVTALFLSSCENDDKISNKKIFRYNESAGIITLDPAFSRDQAHIWVCNQLYNSLVKLDSNLQIVPSIAKKWTISDDGKVYTFIIKDSVYFHHNDCFTNGTRKVVAGDFVYSFNRLLDPRTASPGSWVLSNIAIINSKHQIEALNDSTLQITLSESFPPFLGILAMKYCSVVPYEAIEYYGDEFRKNPVGTGPFMMRKWVENIKLVLTKNPLYFEFDGGDRLPYLDGVAISFLIDKMTGFMEFVKGNFDFISGIDASYKDELLTRGGNLKEKFRGKFNMIASPYLNTEYLAMFVGDKNSQSPINNLNVRKAINYGFDRHKMIRYLRNNIGTPGNSGIIPAGMPSYDSSGTYGYNYNPLLAQELLSLEGYSDTNPVPEITLTTTPDYLDLSKFVQSQLKDIGIDINIDVSPTATVREMKAHGKLEFFRASWIADYPDEENYLSMFYSQNKAPQGPNYTHYSDVLTDSLYLESFGINSRNSRTQLYRNIDSIIMSEAPVAILYYDRVTLFTQKDVIGLRANAINMLDLDGVRVQ